MLGSRKAACGYAVLLVTVASAGCQKPSHSEAEPVIEFTSVPEAGLGGSVGVGKIEGRATGARQDQRVVLFARTNFWYVQPLTDAPFTPLDSSFHWKSTTHFGTEYAALLVNAGYSPPAQTNILPSKGGPIVAVARVKARGHESVVAALASRQLRFSGFDWQVRAEPSDRGGRMSQYDPRNAWVDPEGRLHLKITKVKDGWRCAEVRLKDSLGYGTYSFSVENTKHLEPAVVIGMYTYDHTAPRENYREMNIELSQWGEPRSKNAQFAIQPFYVPANVVRFAAPAGKLSNSLRWAPRRADFTTTETGTGRLVAQYSFTSGVPAPGVESLFIALYRYELARAPLTRESEVVIERFEYRP